MERKILDMKVTAHLVVAKGYNRAIMASQELGTVLNHCEEHNREYYGDGYLSEPKDEAVVTVEFEVPDSVFERQPTTIVPGEVVKNK